MNEMMHRIVVVVIGALNGCKTIAADAAGTHNNLSAKF